MADPLEACDNFLTGNLTGQIALISRGSCYFLDKVYHAQLAGAVAVVVHNNLADADLIQMGTASDFGVAAADITIPSYLISMAGAAGWEYGGRRSPDGRRSLPNTIIKFIAPLSPAPTQEPTWMTLSSYSPSMAPTTETTVLVTTLAPSESTVSTELILIGMTSFGPAVQAIFVLTWKTILGVDNVEIVSYSINGQRRESSVSVVFQALAPDQSQVAALSSSISQAATDSGSSSFQSTFNTGLASSPDAAVASEQVQSTSVTATPSVTSSAPTTSSSTSSTAESDAFPMILWMVICGGIFVGITLVIALVCCCRKFCCRKEELPGSPTVGNQVVFQAGAASTAYVTTVQLPVAMSPGHVVNAPASRPMYTESNVPPNGEPPPAYEVATTKQQESWM